MRVIIVTQTFPPRFGGMQSVMSALAKNFSKTIPTFVLPDHHIPDSHPIRSYKIKFNFSNFPKFLRPLIKKIKLKKILKKDDIIICDSWKSLNALPNTNNKVVMLAHGQEYLSKSKKNKINKLLKKVNIVISSSNYTKNIFLNICKFPENKIYVIPPTYELENNKIEIHNKSSNKKDLILTTISRLEERKGFLPVIKALKNLVEKKSINNFTWSIYGDGYLKEKINKQIDYYKLNKYIKIKNFVNEVSKEQILLNSNLFIMPSYKVKNSVEGFGISYIEAAKFSVPSISGVDGGVLDAVVNNETGWNVDTLNEKELENVIFEAINNQNKRDRFGKNARQLFIKKFSSDKVFRKFMTAITNSSNLKISNH